MALAWRAASGDLVGDWGDAVYRSINNNLISYWRAVEGIRQMAARHPFLRGSLAARIAIPRQDPDAGN
jgi:hypothetical protein